MFPMEWPPRSRMPVSRRRLAYGSHYQVSTVLREPISRRRLPYKTFPVVGSQPSIIWQVDGFDIDRFPQIGPTCILISHEGLGLPRVSLCPAACRDTPLPTTFVVSGFLYTVAGLRSDAALPFLWLQGPTPPMGPAVQGDLTCEKTHPSRTLP